MKNMHFSNSILRYAVLLICFLPMALYAHGAQGKRIILKGQSITMQQAIQLIEENSQYTFFFKSGVIANDEKKDYDCEGDINEVLRKVFSNSGIDYVIKNNEIILKSAKAEAVQQKSQGPKKSEIVGVVVDANTGESIIGASVQIKGAATGVITNIDGKFTIMAAPSDVILISYVGYTPKEIKIGSRKVLSIDLNEDAKQLEEVVITAYGTGQKKASMVGSVESIKPAELKVPSTNLSTAFAGRLAGVIAVQKSGQPGADGANFWIRGVSTMNGVTDPLIILDGVQVSSSDLNNLDPEIIDSFSILKDATATAMYGTRGANGVMIVTTKSGMNLDKPIINFRMEAQMSQPTSTPKFVDGATYMELFNEAVNNDNSGDVLYSQDRIDGTRAGLNPYIYPNVNWYDELFKDASYSEKFNFNIRGGGKRVDYFSSISVNHESGMLKNRSKDFFSYNNNIEIMRYNFQNNINAKLSNSSKLSLRLNVQLRDMTTPNQGVGAIFNNAMNTSPVEFPVYFPDDGETPYIKWGATERVNADYQTNPVAQAATGYNKGFQSTVIAALEFNQKLDFITEGLSFKALASFKNWSSSENKREGKWNKFALTGYEDDGNGGYTYTTSRIGDEYTTNLTAKNTNSGDRRFYLEGMVNYSRTFGEHDVNAMLIYSQDELVNNTPGDGNFIGSLPQRKQGLAARASYAYAGKYMAEVNVGYNGSENFAKGKRYGLFPSFALGWVISNEPFYKKSNISKIMNSLKIRGSLGWVGNDRVWAYDPLANTSTEARFIYLQQYEYVDTGNTDNSYIFGIGDNRVQGIRQGRVANKDVSWETSRKLNIGLEAGLFNNALTFNIDYFHERRSDILTQVQTMPSYVGTVFSPANIGIVQNQGVELEVNHSRFIGPDFSYSIKGNMSFARNKVIDMGTPLGVLPYQRPEGYPIDTPLKLITLGYFQDYDDIERSPSQLALEGNTEVHPGDLKYKDINGDGVIDRADFIRTGYPLVPEIQYGINLSLSYKGFDVGVLFQGSTHVSFDKNWEAMWAFSNGDNVYDKHWSYWTPEMGDANAKYTQMYGKYQNNEAGADYTLSDGSYIRLKNLDIGYTLPKKITEKAFIKTIRIYFSALNLATWAKEPYLDPDNRDNRAANMPPMKAYNFGLNINF